MPFPSTLYKPAGLIVGALGGLATCPIHGDMSSRLLETFASSRPWEWMYDASTSNARLFDLMDELATFVSAGSPADGQEPLDRRDRSATIFGTSYMRPPVEALEDSPICSLRTSACKRSSYFARFGWEWGISACPATWSVQGNPMLMRNILITWANAQHLSDDAGWPDSPSMDHYYRFNDTETVSTAVLYSPTAGLYLGNYLGAKRFLAESEQHTVVFSLCRVGDDFYETNMQVIEVWLNDSIAPEANPHLPFALWDIAQTVAQLLQSGHRVLVHCVVGRSRSLAVGCLALAISEKMAFDHALDRVLQSHATENPGALVSFAAELWRQRMKRA